MDLLFGGMPDAARFVVAFLLVLGLIGAGAYLWRKFGTGTLSTTGPRGRQPRLAVIDAASVDGRRRLVLIRRDNTEHLLMIGGPTDIVVEANIARAGANSAGGRDPRPIPAGEIPPRQATPAEGSGWTQPFEPGQRPIRSLEDLDATRPEAAPRSAREAMADTMRAMRSEPSTRPAPSPRPEPDDAVTAPALTPPMPPEPNYQMPAMPEPPRRVPVQSVPPPPPAYEPVFQTAPEPRRTPTPPPPYEPVFQTAPEPKRPPPPPLHEPPEPQWPPPPPAHEPVFQSGAAAEPKRGAALPPRSSQTDESNLTEMAQRLEAALRRPTKPVEPPPPPAAPPAPTAVPPAAARPLRPDPAPVSRVAAYFEPPNSPRSAAKAPEPSSPSAPDLKIPGRSEPQAPFESLEDEMAKMLGRPPGKT
jgi:flagellar protein FliO/FliZ